MSEILKFPDKTALLVIDIVNSCCHEECEDPSIGITYNKIRKMVDERLLKFVDAYRNRVNKNVIMMGLQPWTRDYLPGNIVRLYDESPEATYFGEEGFEGEFYHIEPAETDFVVKKNTYDCFANHKLVDYLERRRVTDLVVCGVFTDGCVLSTIASGFSKGYNFIVPRDLVEATDLPICQDMQKILLHYTFPTQYGKVVDSGEIFAGEDE
jgi:nicotinamidase-related amidase